MDKTSLGIGITGFLLIGALVSSSSIGWGGLLVVLIVIAGVNAFIDGLDASSRGLPPRDRSSGRGYYRRRRRRR